MFNEPFGKSTGNSSDFFCKIPTITNDGNRERVSMSVELEMGFQEHPC